MDLRLSEEEARELDEALGTYLLELDRSLVRTDVHALQHALHLTSDRLAAVRARLHAGRAASARPSPAAPA